MADRIEPPILISRLMVFVFAAVAVMAIVLFFTLYKMFPLNRPQIFFLRSQPRNNQEIVLRALPAKDANYDYFVRGFLREYIKVRNEVVPNMTSMLKKWDVGGIVYNWSSPAVYEQLQSTNMWRALMNESPDFEFSCPVEFENGAVKPYAENTYDIKFSYFCADNHGQISRKNYTIRIKLEQSDKTKWQDRLSNPLGIVVSEYSVVSGNGDPLNTGYLDK